MTTTIIRLATIDPTTTATGAAESEPERPLPDPGGPGSVDPTETDDAVACTEVFDPTPPAVKGLVVDSSGFALEGFVAFGLPPESVVVVVEVPELEVVILVEKVVDMSLEEVVVSSSCEDPGEPGIGVIGVGSFVVVGRSKSRGGVLEMMRRRASSPVMLGRKASVVTVGCRFIFVVVAV